MDGGLHLKFRGPTSNAALPRMLDLLSDMIGDAEFCLLFYCRESCGTDTSTNAVDELPETSVAVIVIV